MIFKVAFGPGVTLETSVSEAIFTGRNVGLAVGLAVKVGDGVQVTLGVALGKGWGVVVSVDVGGAAVGDEVKTGAEDSVANGCAVAESVGEIVITVGDMVGV